MRAPVKLLLWLITGISAVCVMLVALLFFVDVNLYRDRIEQHVSTAFGRDVVLLGPLGLEPSLAPRFVVNGLKITNPDWASRPYLATVDKFDIRVSLLPLLRGDLDVVSLEFHGIDLLLEKTADGANNFTFAGSGETAALPAIEHLSLHDATIAFAGPDGPVKRLRMARVTARKVPGEPVELEAHTAVNAVPVALALRGEALDYGQPDGPWQLTLSGTIGDLSLQVDGRIAQPTDWRHGEYRLDLKGRHLDDLETVSGYPLPEAEPVALGANIRLNLDEFIELDDIRGNMGSSDLQGRLRWELTHPRPAIRLRLESQQLSAGDMEIDHPQTPATGETETSPDNPLPDIGALAGTDLDIEIRMQQFTAADTTLNDIVLTAHADHEQFGLALDNATAEDTHITAKATLPWGDSLRTLAPELLGLDTLLQHAALEAQAKAPEAILRHTTDLMGDPLDLVLTSVQASARPGSALTVRGVAALNGIPHTLTLQGEPLAALAQRPAGPWQNLSVEVRGEAIRLDARGSVARPLEAGGFDVSYALSGPDINVLLPLQGPWSLAGNYADRPDRHVFGALKVTLAGSDIGGRIILHQGGPRPRLLANLDAGLINLDKFVPEYAAQSTDVDGLEQPLDINGLAALDLDVEMRVRQLEGLAKPVQDILLTAKAGRQNLALAPVRATIEGVQLDARAKLPWGERLAALGKNGISVRQLLQHTDLALRAKAPAGKLQHEIALMGHQMNLELAGIEAAAPPGKALELSA
ncbi:MAG: AsmA family protein, partial [Gammaproteobacteria bacterium]|nr:AsmA family protein [Gammaproteobacteria bacterium]